MPPASPTPGSGRLCLFDTERKARLLPGSGGQRFDALEIEHPDELPTFIDWALGPEGQQQGYTCYALDSWAMYFGRKHRELLQSVRARTGDVTAQPTADELAADQTILQEVLRRLCVDSGACVVITDQIAAKNRRPRRRTSAGAWCPMTASGLEYFVDVMLELSLRVDGFETVRVARVVKSNAPAFPVGLELTTRRSARSSTASTPRRPRKRRCPFRILPTPRRLLRRPAAAAERPHARHPARPRRSATASPAPTCSPPPATTAAPTALED